jgi:hypothetical protein
MPGCGLYRGAAVGGYQRFGVFDTQEQASQAIAAEIEYAAGGGLYLRRQPVENSGFRGVTMRKNVLHGQMWRSDIYVLINKWGQACSRLIRYKGGGRSCFRQSSPIAL